MCVYAGAEPFTLYMTVRKILWYCDLSSGAAGRSNQWGSHLTQAWGEQRWGDHHPDQCGDLERSIWSYHVLCTQWIVNCVTGGMKNLHWRWASTSCWSSLLSESWYPDPWIFSVKVTGSEMERWAIGHWQIVRDTKWGEKWQFAAGGTTAVLLFNLN